MNKGGSRRSSASKLLAGAAPATEAGIVDQGAVTPPVVTDPPIPASAIVPAVPAGTEPDGAAVLLDPTLTGEPDAPHPIVTAAPVLAMEPSATDVVQADARAERIAEGLEPGATGDAALDAVAGQPTIAIEGGAGAAAVAARTGEVEARIGDLHVDGELRVERHIGRNGEVRTLPNLDQIADALGDMAQYDPEGFDYLQARFFSGGASSAVFHPAATANTVDVVSVAGPPQGRRRAGMSFGSAPRLFLASDLTDDDIAALRADPALAVSINAVTEDELGRTALDVFTR